MFSLPEAPRRLALENIEAADADRTFAAAAGSLRDEMKRMSAEELAAVARTSGAKAASQAAAGRGGVASAVAGAREDADGKVRGRRGGLLFLLSLIICITDRSGSDFLTTFAVVFCFRTTRRLLAFRRWSREPQ